MPVKHENAVIAIGQAVQAAQMFATVNPSISTIRHPAWRHDGTIKDLRDGERIAAVFVIGTGIALAFALDDMSPVWTSLLATGVMVGITEWAIATRHPGAGEAGDEAVELTEAMIEGVNG